MPYRTEITGAQCCISTNDKYPPYTAPPVHNLFRHPIIRVSTVDGPRNAPASLLPPPQNTYRAGSYSRGSDVAFVWRPFIKSYFVCKLTFDINAISRRNKANAGTWRTPNLCLHIRPSSKEIRAAYWAGKRTCKQQSSTISHNTLSVAHIDQPANRAIHKLTQITNHPHNSSPHQLCSLLMH